MHAHIEPDSLCSALEQIANRIEHANGRDLLLSERVCHTILRRINQTKTTEANIFNVTSIVDDTDSTAHEFERENYTSTFDPAQNMITDEAEQKYRVDDALLTRVGLGTLAVGISQGKCQARHVHSLDRSTPVSMSETDTLNDDYRKVSVNSQSIAIKRYTTTARQNKFGRYECPQCERSYKDYTRMITHRRSHTRMTVECDGNRRSKLPTAHTPRSVTTFTYKKAVRQTFD
jgi:hypothetical protein